VYRDLLKDERFQKLLLRYDQDLARDVQQAGCPKCSGRLDQANYPRKPRGDQGNSDPAIRLSLCCAVEGCRGRALPPSVRFLGRRVYLGLAFVIAGWVEQGGERCSRAQVRERIGVSRRTLQRWRRWWTATLPRTRLWEGERGRFESPIASSDLPRGLLDRFAGGPGERVMALLWFLSPLTTTSLAGQPAF
jgi:hypothetical protein